MTVAIILTISIVINPKGGLKPQINPQTFMHVLLSLKKKLISAFGQ
jgi:hypothetical protein